MLRISVLKPTLGPHPQCCGISVLKPIRGRIPHESTVGPVDAPIGVQLTAEGRWRGGIADLRAAGPVPRCRGGAGGQGRHHHANRSQIVRRLPQGLVFNVDHGVEEAVE
jgi:hypothetical protein